MRIQFTKMHGLGNDFMVIDGTKQTVNLNPELISRLAQRNTGVGFDQCLLIEPSLKEDIDFNYRIFNADGQEVGQCGNGARCLALFAKHYGLTNKNKLRIATNTTQMHLEINPDNSVSVDMGIPHLNPKDIPFIAEQQASDYLLTLDTQHTAHIHAISVGNPHAVLLVSNVNSAPVQSLGKQICEHPAFPEQTNVGFMQILNAEHIKLRVYERGCGETLACGSGAVAAAAIGRLYHHLADRVKVCLPGGELIVNWPKLDGPIILTGPGLPLFMKDLCFREQSEP